jgi:hypothetical protein
LNWTVEYNAIINERTILLNEVTKNNTLVKRTGGKEVYLVDMKDKDPSEMGFANFTNLIQETYPLTFSGLLEKKLFLRASTCNYHVDFRQKRILFLELTKFF